MVAAAAVRRARRSVRPRMPRGDGRQPVPRRRAARGGGGSRPRAHRGRRGRSRRDRPARRRQRGAAPAGATGARRPPRSPARSVCSATARRLATPPGWPDSPAPTCEAAMAALVSAGVVESGGTVRFTHPILRTAIYERPVARRARAAAPRGGDDPARARSAGRPGRGAGHAHRAGRRPGAVALLRDAARDALALGDAAGAAALLSRALESPPPTATAPRSLLELGQAHARAGAPEAIEPADRRSSSAARTRPRSPRRQSSSAACSSSPAARPKERRSCAAPRSGSRPGSRHASSSRSRCSASAPPRRRPGARPRRRSPPCETRAARHATCCRPPRSPRWPWTRCCTCGSASTAIDLAERAIAAGLPLEPHRGENWANSGPGARSGSRTVLTLPCGARTRSSRGRARAARH